jgi:hypothetical protein
MFCSSTWRNIEPKQFHSTYLYSSNLFTDSSKMTFYFVVGLSYMTFQEVMVDTAILKFQFPDQPLVWAV